VSLKLSVFDRKGALEIERELNENGHPPGLDVIGVRSLRPGALADLYQPFYEFGPQIDLGRLHFDLLFVAEGHASPPVAIHADAVVSLDVQPTPYYPVSYCLPLRGLIVVHDGHDFYSHHRRYDLAARYDVDPSSAVSSNLFAYDFMRTTSSGSLFSGDPNRAKDWLTYGEPVFAPADGMVLEAVSDLQENAFQANGDIQIPEDAERRDPS
jgi:hypothetical protein